MSIVTCLKTVSVDQSDLDELRKLMTTAKSESEAVQAHLSSLVDELEGVRSQLVAKGFPVKVKDPFATAPSEIAKEAAGIVGKRGTKLTQSQKNRLKQLHTQWIAEQQSAPKAEVKPEARKEGEPLPKGQRKGMAIGNTLTKEPGEFIRAVAEEQFSINGKDDSASTEQRARNAMEMIQRAPDRPEMMEAINNSPYVKAAVELISKIEQGRYLAKAGDYFAFHDAEKALITDKAEAYSPEVQAELDKETESIEKKSLGGFDAEASVVVEKTPEQGTFGKASEVRKVEATAEEKAALAAKYNTKSEIKEKVAVAEPKTPTPEVTQRVTYPKVEAIKKKAKPKLPVGTSREERLHQSGLVILEWRRQAQAAARDNKPGLEGLLRDIKGMQEGIRKVFGQAALDRTNQQVEAMLKHERTDAIRVDKTNNNYRDPSTGKLHKIIATYDVNSILGSTDNQKIHKDLLDWYVAPGESRIIGAAAFKMMLPRILKLAGDTKINVVSNDSSIFQDDLLGWYDNDADVIVIPERVLDDGALGIHVIMHEAAHAAFNHAMYLDPKTAQQLQILLDHINSETHPDLAKMLRVNYGLTNIKELIAEAWSNPRFQVFLSGIEIPAEMARKMGLAPFKRYSIWSGFLNVVRKAIGLSPSANTAFEAVVVATNRIVANKLPDDTQSYWNSTQNEMWDSVPEYKGPDAIRMVQNEVVGELRNRVPGGRMRKNLLKVMTLDQVTQLADKDNKQGLGMKVSDIVGSAAVRREELMREAENEVVTEAQQLFDKHIGPVWDKFVDMTDRSTSSQVNIAQPLTHEDNKHINKRFKWSSARALHAELNPEFNKLPADLQAHWHKSSKFYKNRQDTLSLNGINNIIAEILGRKDKQLAQRIHEGFVAEADKELFMTNAAMNAISKMRELKKWKGVYFPKMRRGDYVLTGIRKIPAQFAGNETEPGSGAYIFDSRKEAEDFESDMRKSGVNPAGTDIYSIDLTSKKKHYTYADPATGDLLLDPKTNLAKKFRYVKGDLNTKQVWEVKVQNKVVEYFETQRKGNLAWEAYKQDPNFEINGLQQKEELTLGSSHISTLQLRRAIDSIEATKAYKDKDPSARRAMTQALKEMSLSYLTATAAQQRSLPRRNVLGASKEFTRNVAEYASVSSSAIANSEIQPELDKAMGDLDKWAKDHKEQSPSLTLPRSQILQEIYNQVSNQEAHKPKIYNKVIQTLLRIAFLKHLASPAYVMINLTQPFMLSIPSIGGRHGYLSTSMAMSKAYSDMGFFGMMGSGIRDTKNAAVDLFSGTTTDSTDYIGNLHSRLAKLSDGKELTAVMDYFYKVGIVNRDAGIEIAEMIESPGAVAHTLRSIEHIARQTSVAAEVINRVATGVTAFRLERARGASFEEAQTYARNQVANTQGIYQYHNAPAAFKHPLMSFPLQFRKYSQLYYNLLAGMIHKTFKGATRAERIEGGKQLAGVFVTHVAMAGAMGLPTEPFQILFGTLAWLGLPVPPWEEIERKATEVSKGIFGDNFGDALVHGLPRLAGVDVHSRLGANTMTLFGAPGPDASAKEWYEWTAKTTLGAPGGVVTDVFQAKSAFEDGEYVRAAGLLSPLKFITDVVKGAQSYTVGKTNKKGEQIQETGGLADALIRATGFTPAWQAREAENKSAARDAIFNRKEQRQDLIDAWKAASGKERGAVQKLITKFNKGVPKDSKITGATLARSLKRGESDKKKGYTKKGVYGGKQNKDILDQYLGD